MVLKVYRGSAVNTTIKIDARTQLIQEFFGEDRVYVEYDARAAVDLAIGDYIRYNGLKYYLNALPSVVKEATNKLRYSCNFESQYYDLSKVQFMFYGAGDFDLMGNLTTFVDLICTNMNRVQGAGTWATGTLSQTDETYQLLHFSAETCREVIQRLCTEFSCELWFDGTEIHAADKAASTTGVTLQYKAGLRGITRKTDDDQNIVTRLYAFGSDKNLGSDYRSGKTRLVFEDGGVNYLEANVANYGIIEHTEIFDNVYPTRTGTISSVDGSDETIFYDTGIDFDLNDYLISGTSAKVHFETGDLAGYEFEVATYTHATTKIVLVPMEIEGGITLPNSTLKPAANDTYKFVDITLPQSYIDTAEATLQTLAQAYLDENCDPRVTYEIVSDPRYFKLHGILLQVGDELTIIDTEIGANATVRVQKLTRSLLNKYDYTVEVSNAPVSTLLQRLYDTGEDLKTRAATDKAGDVVKARRNWRDGEELRTMVFDPDGYFTDAIRPASIETTLLSVGSKAGAFILKEVVIKPNYGGDEDAISITGGTLVHLAVDNDDGDEIGTWTLNANETYSGGGLTTGTAYYLYARCHKTDYVHANNEIVLDSTARKADQGDYWYFPVGVLHSTTAGTPRGISLTYGETLISGNHITTGRIKSADGNTYFDLDTGEIVIATGSASVAWSDIGGDGKPADNATVGADWSANLTNIPATLGTPDDAGLYLGLTNLGYWNGSTWKSYLDNTGNFYLGGTGGPFTYDAATGAVTLASSASGQRVEIDNDELTFYDSTGAQRVKIYTGSSGWILVGDPSGNDETWIRDGYISILNDGGLPLSISRASSSNSQLACFYGYDSAAQELVAYLTTAGNLFLTPPVTSGGNLTLAGNITLYSGKTVDGVDVGSHTHNGANQGGTVPFSALGSKPTTLSGYGITDAAPSSHVGATGAAHGDATSSKAGFMTAAMVSKLAAIEASADVTDATNVAAAGAIMDGDFTSNGIMKRTGAGAYGIVGTAGIALHLLSGAGAGDGYYLRWDIDGGAYWAAS